MPVPFRDAPATAAAVIELLGSDTQRHAMRKPACRMGREIVWPRVAQASMESFTVSGTTRRRTGRCAAARRYVRPRTEERRRASL